MIPQVDASWPKYTITAILGAILGVITTQATHGTKIGVIEVELKLLGNQLDRIERAVQKQEKK